MTYGEPMVARVIGVQKARLVGVRKAKLTRGADWDLDKAVVVYTECGLQKILVELGLADKAFAWPAAESEGQHGSTPDEAGIEATDGSALAVESPISPEKIVVIAAAAAQAVGVECVRVVSIEEARPLVDLVVTSISRNPTIVYAQLLDGSDQVEVKVATNVNFIPGQALQARAPAAGASLYYFEGRCPRWKGRY
jgi:hypothetical protein